MSVLLHAVNAILATALVLRLSKDRTLAVAAGTLFAVHPLVTEAVAWASCLPELLYAAAVLGFLHVHLAASQGTRPRPLLVVAATGLLLLGLLSKETAIAALPLAFVLEWLRGQRIGAAVRGLTVYLIPVAVVFVLRLAVLGGVAPQASGEVGTWRGVLLVPKVLLSYLGFLIAPNGLSAHHLLGPGWTLAPADVPARLQLGVSLLRGGDAPGAVLALEEASRAAPANAEVWNVLGAAYATAGRMDEATQAWERAVALDPHQEKARLNLERLRGRQARDAAR